MAHRKVVKLLESHTKSVCKFCRANDRYMHTNESSRSKETNCVCRCNLLDSKKGNSDGWIHMLAQDVTHVRKMQDSTCRSKCWCEVFFLTVWELTMSYWEVSPRCLHSLSPPCTYAKTIIWNQRTRLRKHREHSLFRIEEEREDAMSFSSTPD